jgi:Zn-dependent M28 family amino/carboxypeptidase
MVYASPSRSRKILQTIILFVLLAALALLLIGCPGRNADKNVPGGKTVRDKLLDSAALINRLAHLTTEEMAGRESATAGGLLAQQFVLRQFDSLKIEKAFDSYLQPFKLRNDSTKSGANVVGIIKGTRYPDSYIAVTAHYDHVGTRNGAIYFGADDNASGTAALLTLAQYFKKNPPQHSLLIVAFDAEEKGLQGSRYFVDHLPVPLSSIIMNVNMDMVSRNDKNEIFACGIYHYPFLKKYVDSVQQLTSVNIRFGHDDPKDRQQDWTTQSDHYAFHLKKIPFLYFGVEDHADYHKPTDTFDKIDKSFYYSVCEMMARMILVLDSQERIE